MSVAKFITHLNRASKSLSAVEATVFGPTDLHGQALISFVVVNSSLTETVTGRLLAGDGTSFCEEPWDGLKDITPGEVRRVEFSIAGCKFVKVVATATGAATALVSVYTHTHP